MQGLIVNFIYLTMIVYAVMALFIAFRDIFISKRKILWISVIGVVIGVVVLFTATKLFNALALPIGLMISVPIFITDKRRNWDMVDKVFRVVSVIALICAIFLFLNYYFLR